MTEKRLDPAPSTMDRAAFVASYGGVYEHSPWIAEAAWDAGLGPASDTAEGLAARLRPVVDAASRTRKRALLRAHPDLAGRLALAGGLTAASTAEQAGAGLDQCAPEELAEFKALNDRYTAKFGFPFILAVRGRHRREILEIFRHRVGNTPETEFAEAIAQTHRIALLRLQAMTAA